MLLFCFDFRRPETVKGTENPQTSLPVAFLEAAQQFAKLGKGRKGLQINLDSTAEILDSHRKSWNHRLMSKSSVLRRERTDLTLGKPQ